MSRHGEKGYNVAAPFVNYRANIWALKEHGVQEIISWSGPAAIDPVIAIGEILIPGDIVDETKAREHTFYTGTGLGFVRQNPVFCPHLSGVLIEAVNGRFGKCRTDDVYVCTEGPRLETPAEIRKFSLYGGTLVGMTLVPEVFLAKELEMCYASMCYTTNYAEGLPDDDERKAADNAVNQFPMIINSLAMRLAWSKPTCHCNRLMDDYRREGIIGPDWHTWIGRR
jgi:5'-methylthioadenosine phosphorylase